MSLLSTVHDDRFSQNNIINCLTIKPQIKSAQIKTALFNVVLYFVLFYTNFAAC